MRSLLFSSLLTIATLLHSTTTTATYTHPPSSKICKDYKIPLTIRSENYIFALPTFKNNYDVTDFWTDFASRTAERDFHPFAASGRKNHTATYTIAGTFCEPRDKGAKNRKTVLLATHGLNFNRG